MKRSIFYVLINILVLCSCGEYECSKAEARFLLIGFSNIETDTIMFRKYTKSTNFVSTLDTVLITPNNTSYYFNGDTLQFTAFSSNILITSNFDYEISLPKARKTFKLAKITEKQRSLRRSFGIKRPPSTPQHFG